MSKVFHMGQVTVPRWPKLGLNEGISRSYLQVLMKFAKKVQNTSRKPTFTKRNYWLQIKVTGVKQLLQNG